MAAVDHVGHSVTAIVHSKSEDLNLTENQTIQKVGASCSYLNYQLPLPRVSGKYKLTVYAEDSCKNEGIVL